ncbi:MAG: hypothetical protein EXS67_03445 [Candidatus Margulisbacteria bacterium]|nr:hypothetical protein [Candidatus Margulisiibacteriota bacterium]
MKKIISFRPRAFSSPARVVSPGDIERLPETNFVTPTKNQNSERVLLRSPNDISNNIKEMLLKKETQVGKVVLNRRLKSQVGLGSGVLIGDRYFLTAKHVVDQSLSCSVVLGTGSDFCSKGSAYSVKKIILPESQEAIDLGLHCGKKGDFVILELEEKNGQFPGNVYGYTRLNKPEDMRPALYFQGFQSGTNLKMSASLYRPKSLTFLIARKFKDWGNRLVGWNRTSHGYITQVNESGGETEFLLRSPTQRPIVIVDDAGGVSKNGRKLVSSTQFEVLLAPQFGADHVVVAHATGGGCSGGVYFTENGDIYAIHMGAIDRHGLKEHVAYFPWAESVTDIYKESMELEARNNKSPKSEFIPVSFTCPKTKSMVQIESHQGKHASKGWPDFIGEKGTCFSDKYDVSPNNVAILQKSWATVGLENLIGDSGYWHIQTKKSVDSGQKCAGITIQWARHETLPNHFWIHAYPNTVSKWHAYLKV